jgi:hypothetical protein
MGYGGAQTRDDMTVTFRAEVTGVAFHFLACYDFCQMHGSLGLTPAMKAGISD